MPLLVAAVFVALLAHAPASGQDDPGRFEIRSASVQLSEGVYYLDAWVEYRLSSEAREALDAGLPLIIRLDVEFLSVRRFWIDDVAAALRQSYQLQFHALSERYIVLNINSGEQNTFATLFSALNYLGRISELPLIDVALFDPDRSYDVRIRALLSTEDIPGPLRLLAFWRRDWSLRSEWYAWRLGQE